MMNDIFISERRLVPEGTIYRVTVGCREYFSTDKAFVAEWISAYIADPTTTRLEFEKKYDHLKPEGGNEPMLTTAMQAR